MSLTEPMNEGFRWSRISMLSTQASLSAQMNRESPSPLQGLGEQNTSVLNPMNQAVTIADQTSLDAPVMNARH